MVNSRTDDHHLLYHLQYQIYQLDPRKYHHKSPSFGQNPYEPTIIVNQQTHLYTKSMHIVLMLKKTHL